MFWSAFETIGVENRDSMYVHGSTKLSNSVFLQP